MRRRALNEMIVVLYRTQQGVSSEPLKFDIPCGNRLSFTVPPDHRSSLRYDKGALVELRDWYNGRAGTQRDWQLGRPAGSIGGQPIVYQVTIDEFSDLDGLHYSDTDSLKKALEAGLQALAYRLCRQRANSHSITAFSWWEYHYELLRHYCMIEMDVYQATNMRARMRDADFGAFMNDADQAVAQSTDGWATVKATVRRAGNYAPEDVIVRDVSGIRTVYMKLGLADFTVQTHWQRTLRREECERRRGAVIDVTDEYEEKPSRPDEQDGLPELGELDPTETDSSEDDEN